MKLHNRPNYTPKSSANCQDNNTCSILFMLLLCRWAQAKCCQGEKSNTPSLTSHVMNNHIGRLSTFLCEINKSHSETKINSNSHGAPCSNIGQEQLQTSRLEPTGNQSLSQTLMANHGNLCKSLRILFDFQTLELIFQSLQPSQNCAKDPKRNSWERHLHGSSPRTLRF